MTHIFHVRTLAMAGLALATLLLGLPLAAQQDRDPTVAPSESSSTSASGASVPKAVEGMSVLVRDGQSFLVVGTRLYGLGDTVGNLRVQRITETEVWLHDGNALIKVPRFTGIERRAIAAKPLCAGAQAAPCEDTPP